MIDHISAVQARIIKHAAYDGYGLVLFDWMDKRLQPSNLFKCDTTGIVLWVAGVPGPNEKYVSFDVADQTTIYASTFSGYRVRIDLLDGSSSEPTFTK